METRKLDWASKPQGPHPVTYFCGGSASRWYQDCIPKQHPWLRSVPTHRNTSPSGPQHHLTIKMLEEYRMGVSCPNSRYHTSPSPLCNNLSCKGSLHSALNLDLVCLAVGTRMYARVCPCVLACLYVCACVYVWVTLYYVYSTHIHVFRDVSSLSIHFPLQ